MSNINLAIKYLVMSPLIVVDFVFEKTTIAKIFNNIPITPKDGIMYVIE